jgi:hypothetical protein
MALLIGILKMIMFLKNLEYTMYWFQYRSIKQKVTFYDRDQSRRLHRRLAISDLGFASRLGRPLIGYISLFTVQLY